MATSALGGALPAANTTLPSISRRSLVAGLAVAPLAACAAPAVASSAEWDAAVLAVSLRHDEQERFYAAHVKPKTDAHDIDKLAFSAATKAEDDWAPYVDATYEAVDAMLLVPAPNHAAVNHKLQTILDYNIMDGSGRSEGVLRALMSDVTRLGGAL